MLATAHCILHTTHCLLHTTPCTLPAAHYPLHTTAHCPLHTAYCTLYTAHCCYTLDTAHYTLHTAQCILCTSHCTLPTVYCILHTAHCPLYTAHHILSTEHYTLHTVRSHQNCSPLLPEHKCIHSFAFLLFTQTSLCCGFNNIISPTAWFQCHSKATVNGAGSLPTNQSRITAFPLVVTGPTQVSFSSYTNSKVHECTAPLSPTDEHT